MTRRKTSWKNNGREQKRELKQLSIIRKRSSRKERKYITNKTYEGKNELKKTKATTRLKTFESITTITMKNLKIANQKYHYHAV